MSSFFTEKIRGCWIPWLGYSEEWHGNNNMSHVNYCQSIARSRKPIAKAGLSAESALSFSSRSMFFSNSSAFSAMPVTNLPQIQDSVQATSTVPARWKVCAVQSVPNLLGITNRLDRPPKKVAIHGTPMFWPWHNINLRQPHCYKPLLPAPSCCVAVLRLPGVACEPPEQSRSEMTKPYQAYIYTTRATTVWFLPYVGLWLCIWQRSFQQLKDRITPQVKPFQ